VCSHPNIVEYHSSQRVQDHYYLEMERLSTTLEYQCGKDQHELMGWLLGLAEGLAHMHSMGIVHRDIKLPNLMLSHSGVPKIIDFGAATFIWNLRTDSDLLIGTKIYMAPEVFMRR
jgi:serine/threonine protein kinase